LSELLSSAIFSLYVFFFTEFVLRKNFRSTPGDRLQPCPPRVGAHSIARQEGDKHSWFVPDAGAILTVNSSQVLACLWSFSSSFT